MPTLPAISICIPTRNQAEFIGDALASAFAQNRLPLEVIVSDDASNDATPAVVQGFRAALPGALAARLKYLRNHVALGFGGNFDMAVSACAGDYCVKLDSDDILEPTFLEVLGSGLDASSKAGWAHSNVLNIQPDGTPIGRAHTLKRGGFYSAEPALLQYLHWNDTCHCVMLRMTAYREVGGYKKDMRHLEDWLLWLEFLFSGWGYFYDERPLARMRRYQGWREGDTQKRIEFIESATHFINRVEVAIDAKKPPMSGTSAEHARRLIRQAIGRLCRSHGLDEASKEVRYGLMGTAYRIDPSVRNWLCYKLLAPLPIGLSRFGVGLGATPRKLARQLLQRLLQSA
jgi:glycosyltransferase involved in cell wall biosynthesis